MKSGLMLASSFNGGDENSRRKNNNHHAHGSVPETCHPGVRAITRYWESIHPSQGLPGRQHFDPVTIPNLLPNIRLIDVVGPPYRFRVRLTGTRLTEFFGASDTDRWMDEVYPRFEATETHENYVRVCETHCPNWRIGPCHLRNRGECLEYERVQLPFASDGESVDMILIYGVFGTAGDVLR